MVVSIFIASRTITVSSSFMFEPSVNSILNILPARGACTIVPSILGRIFIKQPIVYMLNKGRFVQTVAYTSSPDFFFQIPQRVLVEKIPAGEGISYTSTVILFHFSMFFHFFTIFSISSSERPPDAFI